MGFLLKGVIGLFVFSYGFFSVGKYFVQAIKLGLFFKSRTEKETLELQLAHDRLWNLSKQFSGLSHHFLTLASGFKFHFVSNDQPSSKEVLTSNKPLVIFIHGYPDSWAVWRYIISSPELQESAHLVAIDLPNFGGSQTLKASATNVLENLTQAIINLRIQYGVDQDSETNKKKTIIVAHDWGFVLSARLATEASPLADRFIMSNGPLPSLAVSNISRMLSSASKMVKDALRSPLSARIPLGQAWQTLAPLRYQISMSGYIFAMIQPALITRYFLNGGNRSFIKAIHIGSYGTGKPSVQDLADCMASTTGPSSGESKTQTAAGDTYPTTIRYDGPFANAMGQADYYRGSVAAGRWRKSLETVATLHNLSGGQEPQGAPNAIKARSTIFWGKKDIALNTAICLDGIADFLPKDSQVVLLPDSGHFTPLEPESRVALTQAVLWAIEGEQSDIGEVLKESGAEVIVRK